MEWPSVPLGEMLLLDFEFETSLLRTESSLKFLKLLGEFWEELWLERSVRIRNGWLMGLWSNSASEVGAEELDGREG